MATSSSRSDKARMAIDNREGVVFEMNCHNWVYDPCI